MEAIENVQHREQIQQAGEFPGESSIVNETTETSARDSELAFTVGGAQIHLQQVQLRDDILIDAIHLNGKEARFEMDLALSGTERPPRAVDNSARPYRLSVPETEFTAMISEPNIQRLLNANLPANTSVRNVRLLLLSGKARVTGQFVKSVLSLPFTVEAIPIVENGVRIKLDFQEARLGIKVPGPVLEVIEQLVDSSLSLDLSKLPFPVRLDEIKCDPGRLTIKGKTRIHWPPVIAAPPLAPFAAMERALPTEQRLSAPSLTAFSAEASEAQK